MKYQRVLYTKNFSAELKSKLRIASYHKRRSVKGNVYYVNFACDADITYADRICKRIRNVTMKPFQSRSVDDIQYQHRSKRCDQEKSDTSITPTSCHQSASTIMCSSKQINQVVQLSSTIPAIDHVSHCNINDNKYFLYILPIVYFVL